ncbi:MAG TPA: methyltransferase domain-containing protein [Pyrinomonadaceae bacterium]|nr:methyltransferase domain-containing protein [Pyrinomonadaceae bacterium]
MERIEDLNAYQNAYGPDFKFNDENLATLDWYSSRMCADMRKNKVESVLSLGIGHRIVSQNISDEFSHNLKRHLILEGAKEIIENYKNTYNPPPQVEIRHTYFEEFQTDELFDAIEAGFVLEHVDDPAIVINHIKQFLKPSGKMYLAVPNARSLHRIIGHEAGMLDNYYKLSIHDLQLGHKRYFDLNSFTKFALDCGLKICNVEGIFLKPVTTDQLNQLNLDPRLWKSLLKVGVNFPDICNSIYMETTV